MQMICSDLESPNRKLNADMNEHLQAAAGFSAALHRKL